MNVSSWRMSQKLEIFTLEKNHSTKKQCGLCDRNFVSSKTLDDHLSKCEIFMCSNSVCRDYFEKVTEIKEHILNEHRKMPQSIIHFHTGLFIQKIKVIMK